MSYSALFALLLITPLFFSLLCFACRLLVKAQRHVVTFLHTTGITLLLILALWLVNITLNEGGIFAANLWLHLDSLSGLFLGLLGVIGFLTGIYSIGYMGHEVDHGEISQNTLCDYYGFSISFYSPCCWWSPVIT